MEGLTGIHAKQIRENDLKMDKKWKILKGNEKRFFFRVRRRKTLSKNFPNGEKRRVVIRKKKGGGGLNVRVRVRVRGEYYT